ncbi:helicase-related protein [Aliarcobacter cryaerophilus]|uniref:helicase-related protein n=1 Tax=Aliarcobacter cryaerophilus TaxID=28198 RepID=UPI0021B6A350|nr:helicase-related protein [Aliarcobacter cryaerophilus]MCT7493060.1 helicase-related protein [Aliarcobacter cryaerophilus]
MSSKFFTNQGTNTLENRLKDILTHYDIKNLEFLIGYFRISGFKKIAKLLDNVDKVRILVGINIDKLTHDAQARGKKFNLFDYEKFNQEFIENQKECLTNEEYTQEVDESVNQFIKLIAQNRLEIRISQDKNIHSKIYILRENEIKRHNDTTEYRGSVITGSSNLTENGLSKNYEFNVELKYSEDIEFALNEFNDLWIKSVEITEKDIDTIKQNSYLKEITPYELYLKFLIEHFEDRVDYDASVAEDLPKGYMKLAYQIDAVNEGLSKIKKHSGFFLSDVVGLGKTITSAMIVKRLCYQTKGQILIIAPPSIEKEWNETFKEFQIGSIRKFDFKSYGALEKIKDTEDYEIVIIDESHKFKNFLTSRYKELERICKEDVKYKKKVILISATPLNNKPQDIANQLYLFQDKRNSTIDSHPNLETFFAEIDKNYREIISIKENQSDLSEDELMELEQLSKKVRDNILREVMVRRTRTDIQTNEIYKKDLIEQNLNIPHINPVEELEYKLDDDLLKIFDRTISILMEDLKYYRYQILANLTQNGQKKYGEVQAGFFEKSALSLADIMKTMLVKRLESSFVAFKSTISKQCKNLEILISMFENGVVYIPAKHFNLFELLENDEDDFLAKVDYFLENEKMKAFDSKDFKDEYLEQLKTDLEILQELVKLWENIDSDPKLDKFKSILELHKTDKVVVFTESKQTALYLEEQLKEYKRVLTVHGENRDKLKEVIRENFDANYKNKKDDFNVIISTDTLSEGVNMHRSNIIYNYDIPWNSTRLMQRIGRINRIGTKHSEIFIYNFKPTAQSESLIELSKKAFIKLQTFHHAVGEDSQIYSKNEKVGTVSLYEVEVEKADEELKFLEEIRKYKEANPKTFKYLKELPKKVRVQRDIKDLKETSFVFIKNNDSKSYYMVDNQNCEAVNFVKMATQLKTTKDEVAINPIKEFHYSHVKKAIEMYDKEISDIAVQTTNVKVEHKSDKESIGKLKSWIDKDFITTELYEIFIKTIKDGKLQNLSKEIVNIAKKYQSKDIIVKLEELQKKYNLFEKKESPKIVEKKLEIILSETFV